MTIYPTRFMTQITIRMLAPEHARALNAITREAIDACPAAFTTDSEQIRSRTLGAMVQHLKELGKSSAFRLGAFAPDGELVGTVRLLPRKGSKLRHGADVLFLYVRPEWRRRGVGRQLMRELVIEARGIDGLRQLELAVSRDSTGAIMLYESLGFESTGVLKDQIRVGDRYHDLVAMWKVL